jgi:signal peptidase II
LKPIRSLALWEGVFHLTYVENRGAAFGMLSNHRWVFMILSTMAILGLSVYLFWGRSYLADKNEDGSYPILPLFTGLSLAMVISGGIGNMIDRIWLGYVVDFFDFTLIDFAVFNVADCFVTVGAVLLAVSLLLPFLFGKRKKDEA